MEETGSQFTVYPQDVYREGLSYFVSTVILFHLLTSEPSRGKERFVCQSQDETSL